MTLVHRLLDGYAAPSHDLAGSKRPLGHGAYRRLLAPWIAAASLVSVLSLGCGKDPAASALAPGVVHDGGVQGGADGSVVGPSTSDASWPTGVDPSDPGEAPQDPEEPFALDECGDDNPAGLSADQVATLMAGGSASSTRILYPYEGTVFPRGLKAPLVMWDGGGADAVYVHVTSLDFDYKGCLKPSADGRLQIPQKVWTQAGVHTRGAGEPFVIELSFLRGNAVSGPVRRQIVIAQATLSGSIFYNSYNTGLLGGSGAIQRIQPGSDVEQFARQGACTGCHSVSANGARLIASEATPGLSSQGSIYEITPTTSANPNPAGRAASASFVGLYPDGSVFVSSAANLTVGPLLQGGVLPPLNATSVMYETDTGAQVSGTQIPSSAMMPTFSPDGTLLAFNDLAQSGGHSISLMDYDAQARRASNARTLFEDASKWPGWPFVLPDNGAVVFALGSDPAFDGNGVGIAPLITRGPESDLFVVDIKSKKATLLARAMGFDRPEDVGSNKTYLPFGAEELHQAYYPTVSPIASGGYFWIFFDAMRHYGNMGMRRQLWGTALLISKDGSYENDPSYPAFYLDGQDFDTSNHRAFTALDPCKTDGDTCKTGADCCGGYCNFPDGEFVTEGTCSSTVKECAAEGERCTVVTDCCQSDGSQCINGYCGQVIIL